MLPSEITLSLEGKYSKIGGMDEVGYGPFAGPVVTACVWFPWEVLRNIPPELLKVNDSKKIKKHEVRGELYRQIYRYAGGVGVGYTNVGDIDTQGIRICTDRAFNLAVRACDPRPDYFLIDGNIYPKHLSEFDIQGETVVKGDGKEFPIAAASIVAKFYRDSLMIKLHERFPHYGFDRHKGYGTKAHIEALKKHGVTEFHRKTYLKNVF